MEVRNLRTGGLLAYRCHLATRLLPRTVGLLRRSGLEEGEGLLLRPCSSVHTFFMRFPIDVLFLDGNGKVLKQYNPLKQWRASAVVWGAKQTLELPAGVLASSNTRVGDTLLIEP